MESYNEIIADKLLENQKDMIANLPQPTMFGGSRPMSYVLPAGNTAYDYPATLAVGSGRKPRGTRIRSHLASMHPHLAAHMAGGVGYSGSAMYHPHAARARGHFAAMHPHLAAHYQGGAGYSGAGFWDDVGKGVGSVLSNKDLQKIGVDYLKDQMGGAVRRRGRPRRHPIASHMAGGAGYSGAGFWDDVGKGVSSVLSNKDVQKLGVDYVKSQMGGAIRKRGSRAKSHFAAMHPYLASHYQGGAGYSGAGINNMLMTPWSLAGSSKSKKLGKLHGGKSIANFDRGAIVSEVMAKHGLSLPQASSFVKAHGLY